MLLSRLHCGAQVHGAVGMRRVADVALGSAESRAAYMADMSRTRTALEASTSYRHAAQIVL